MTKYSAAIAAGFLQVIWCNEACESAQPFDIILKLRAPGYPPENGVVPPATDTTQPVAAEALRAYDEIPHIPVKERLEYWDLVYIEVKSSQYLTNTRFRVSHNEWSTARAKGQNYHIWRLYGVGTDKLQVTRIVDPYGQWKISKLGVYISL